MVKNCVKLVGFENTEKISVILNLSLDRAFLL